MNVCTVLLCFVFKGRVVVKKREEIIVLTLSNTKLVSIFLYEGQNFYTHTRGKNTYVRTWDSTLTIL